MTNESDDSQVSILYIEDNLDDQLILKRILNKNINKSLKIDAVKTAKEGYEKILSKKYSIIFLDYRLPDQTGLELLEKIRNEELDTPVIFLTGMGNEKIAVEAMRRGVTDYIIKSEIRSEDFINTIKDLLKEKDTEKKKNTIEYTEIEKKLMDIIKEKDIKNIDLLIKDGRITYTGINRFVDENGIEVTSKILSSLVEKNELIRESEKKVVFCPYCGGVKQKGINYVCPDCDSDNISRLIFISHLLCGYTGDRKKYVTEKGLVCPNCEIEINKVVQTSKSSNPNTYRILGSSFECLDCGVRFDRPKVVHICSLCKKTFTYKNMNYVRLCSYERMKN